MKTSIFPSIIALAAAMTACGHTEKAATVHISNASGEKVYFQPTGEQGYRDVNAADTVISISDFPAYYTLVGKDYQFFPVFISEGSQTEISVDADGKVTVSGTNEAENKFMADHAYLCRAPESIAQYSAEWTAYQQKEIASLDSLIDASGLDKDFSALQKLSNRFVYLNQCLNGVNLTKLFRPGGEKVSDIALPEDFYDFLDSTEFSDPLTVYVPNWFNVVNNAIETKEKLGKITVDNDSYMTIYANQIADPKLRSHYIVSLLELTLKRGYLPDIAKQLPAVKPMVTDPAAIARLAEVEKAYEEKMADPATVKAGSPMPTYPMKDVNGKEYSFSDFKGQYVLVDFWYTGCAPCRAEMPYFDKIAHEFDGKGIKFVSLSVDTGDELYAAWEKMMREKPADPAVLDVNLPEGFKSPLLSELGIHGVPRLMLLDPEGNIVEANAKRPSDPKLRQQITALTTK